MEAEGARRPRRLDAQHDSAALFAGRRMQNPRNGRGIEPPRSWHPKRG